MSDKKLSDFKEQDLIKIIGINCGRDLSRRLCDLGLFEGSEVKMKKNDSFGPIILEIFNSKIALGRGEANKIYGKKI